MDKYLPRQWLTILSCFLSWKEVPRQWTLCDPNIVADSGKCNDFEEDY